MKANKFELVSRYLVGRSVFYNSKTGTTVITYPIVSGSEPLVLISVDELTDREYNKNGTTKRVQFSKKIGREIAAGRIWKIVDNKLLNDAITKLTNEKDMCFVVFHKRVILVKSLENFQNILSVLNNSDLVTLVEKQTIHEIEYLKGIIS